MIVSIHQTAYLPWLGYFDKIAQADVFVYLDTVQFQKNSFQNRNKIRTKTGWCWLTVPVKTKGKLYESELSSIEVNEQTNWRRKHLGALQTNYAKAPYFEREMAYLEAVLAEPWDKLSDPCFAMMMHFLQRLDVPTKVVKSSQLPPVDAAKSDLVLGLCRQLGANCYLSGAQGRDYLDEASFVDAGIEVVFQEYCHPVYQQTYPGFEPYMGIVDALMNLQDPAAFFRDAMASQPYRQALGRS